MDFQSIQMFIGITYHAGNLIKVIAGRSLDELFQTELACHFMYTLNVLLALNIFIGSFGMAFFRLNVIFWPHIVKERLGAMKCAMIIRTLEWFFIIVILVIGNILTSRKKYVPALEFCRSRNPEMAEIISEYNGITDEDHKESRNIQSVILLACILLTIFEVGCYVAIFCHRYQNDQSLKGILDLSVIHGRIRSSSMTFGGQILSFVCKFGIQVFFIAYINILKSFDINSTLALIFSVQQAALALVQIIATPELRRIIFFFNY